MADLIIDDVVKVYNESGKNNGSMIIDGGGLQCRRISYENILGDWVTFSDIVNSPNYSLTTTYNIGSEKIYNIGEEYKFGEYMIYFRIIFESAEEKIDPATNIIYQISFDTSPESSQIAILDNKDQSVASSDYKECSPYIFFHNKTVFQNGEFQDFTAGVQVLFSWYGNSTNHHAFKLRRIVV